MVDPDRSLQLAMVHSFVLMDFLLTMMHYPESSNHRGVDGPN